MAYMIGLVLLQILVIVHVVRTGRTQPWLFVVAFLPLVGSIAYFAVEILPDMLGGRPGQSLMESLRSRFDPEHRYRKLKDIALLTETADAKRALAEECLLLDRYGEAAALFESAMTGLHADDPALTFGLLHARIEAAASGEGTWQSAQMSYQKMQALDPAYRTDQQALFHARIADGLGHVAEAEAAYAALKKSFSGPEARVRYAHFLYRQGRAQDANQVLQTLVAEERQLPRHARRMNAYWFKQAHQALKVIASGAAPVSADAPARAPTAQ